MPEIKTEVVEVNNLRALFLPEGGILKRDKPRPVKLQHETYDEEFDFYCLFYDIFIMPSAKQIRLIGPPFFNLEKYVLDAEINVHCTSSNRLLKINKKKIHNLRKISCLDLHFDETIDDVSIGFKIEGYIDETLSVAKNQTDLFKECNVAFTMFKYEPVEWLIDWARFNVAYHNVDALLVYHNNSTFYTTEEIQKALIKITGLKTVVVIHWPYKYGPQANGTGYWDSNFCQLGMFEQARWKYLYEANGVINSDIDELVVTEAHQSVYEMLGESESGYIQFDGPFVSNQDGMDIKTSVFERRHLYYQYEGVFEPFGKAASKWALVPSKCADDKQWLIHGVSKHRPDIEIGKKVTLCHFFDLTMMWKRKNTTPLSERKKHNLLSEAFDKIGW